MHKIENIKVGLVDDHQLFSKSLAMMLASMKDITVVVEAVNGLDLQKKMKRATVPDIMLIDVEMPQMNGFETAQWLRANFPTIRLAALSMNDRDQTIINMMKAGCCAYLLKGAHPDELEAALHEIHTKGFYNSDSAHVNYRRLMLISQEQALLHFTEKEIEFLSLACSDMAYEQIATLMKIKLRTVEGYREALFHKFNVQSRTGMVLEAIRRGLVKI